MQAAGRRAAVVSERDQKTASGVAAAPKEKSVIVWNYEILLILTAIFSLWNYGSISLMTMTDDAVIDGANDASSNTTNGSADTVVNSPAVDGDAFVFTVMATGAALTLLALLRYAFQSHFSKKMLHSPLLLLVFSIPILLLLVFVGGLYAFDLLD